jgi:alpha-glucosidase
MRAAGYGSQKYSTSMWCGDQSVNWETHDGIASVIPSALSTGIIGNPFTHSDIGGYTSLHGNIRTKELFDRWCEMNVFTSYMRTHEGNRPAENFQYYNNEDSMDLMAVHSNIRTVMLPYLKHLVQEGSELGYPMQRALFMHYENDERAYDIQYQYLFGSDVLVAPVLEAGANTKKVYLPEDEWVHLWTGKEYKGGDVTVSAPVGYPPVFYLKRSKFYKLFEEIGSLNSLK